MRRRRNEQSHERVKMCRYSTKSKPFHLNDDPDKLTFLSIAHRYAGFDFQKVQINESKNRRRKE